jgi:hypothetical protein
MKKIIFIFITLFLVSLNYNLMAQNYRVSGAGTALVNGLYTKTGINNVGYPVWSKGSVYLHADGDGIWVISNNTTIPTIGTIYYYQYSQDPFDPNTPPSNNWDYDMGVLPKPQISFEGIILTYSTNEIDESEKDDGSINSVFSISINKFNGEIFTGNIGDDFVADTKLTINNLPSGITGSAILKNDSTLIISFSGNTSNHNNNFDYNNLGFIFNNNAFSGNNVSIILNSTYLISVNFIQTYTVASSGGDFTKIADAITNSDAHDIIKISGETFTEVGLHISHILTFKGSGANKTIIQAATAKNITTNSVFYANYLLDTIRFYDMTIRYGKRSDAGGDINATCPVILNNCIVKDNTVSATYGVAEGAGIVMYGGIINSSLIVDNICNSNTGSVMGGGIMTYDATTIINSTISGNKITGIGISKHFGGGIYAGLGVLNIINCTITNNTANYSGSGVYVSNVNSYVRNSIIHGNIGGEDLKNTITSNNYVYNSIIGVSSILGINSSSSYVSSSNPKLLPLANNGGVIETHALKFDSPAIDFGDDNYAPTVDQKGYFRRGISDVGASEYNGIKPNQNALNFDGIDDYVQLTKVIPIGNTSNTIEFWTKIPEIGTNNLLANEQVGVILGNADSSPNLILNCSNKVGVFLLLMI